MFCRVAYLFDRNVFIYNKLRGVCSGDGNITLHVSNIFKERELEENSVCKDSLLTAKDGKRYNTKLYNMDIIISVGYHVKSSRGTQFRIWANKVLKDFLLKGYKPKN